MEPIIECVTAAVSKPQDKMSHLSDAFFKVYYHLTAYVPRKLPRDYDQFMKLKSIMVKYYGLEDRPDVWFTVSGQISSTDAHKSRKPYGYMVNAAKRLETNRVAREAKLYFNKLNEDRIKELTENIVASPQPVEPTIDATPAESL